MSSFSLAIHLDKVQSTEQPSEQTTEQTPESPVVTVAQKSLPETTPTSKEPFKPKSLSEEVAGLAPKVVTKHIKKGVDSTVDSGIEYVTNRLTKGQKPQTKVQAPQTKDPFEGTIFSDKPERASSTEKAPRQDRDELAFYKKDEPAKKQPSFMQRQGQIMGNISKNESIKLAGNTVIKTALETGGVDQETASSLASPISTFAEELHKRSSEMAKRQQENVMHTGRYSPGSYYSPTSSIVPVKAPTTSEIILTKIKTDPVRVAPGLLLGTGTSIISSIAVDQAKKKAKEAEGYDQLSTAGKLGCDLVNNTAGSIVGERTSTFVDSVDKIRNQELDLHAKPRGSDQIVAEMAETQVSLMKNNPKQALQKMGIGLAKSAKKSIPATILTLAADRASKTETGKKALEKLGKGVTTVAQTVKKEVGELPTVGRKIDQEDHVGAGILIDGMKAVFNAPFRALGMVGQGARALMHSVIPPSESSPTTSPRNDSESTPSSPSKLTPAQEEHYGTYWDKQSTGDQTSLVEPIPSSTSTTTTSSTSSTRDDVVDNTSSLDPYDKFR